MSPAYRLKLIDQIGISGLAIFLVLSFVFTISPISIMDPGFPILIKSDLNNYTSNWYTAPERATSVYDSIKVKYESFNLLVDESQADTSFSIHHDVTRFSSSEDAIKTLQTNFEKYYDNNNYYRLITNIPGLVFTSNADKYHLWCEQWKREESTSYVGESVDTCYYWSVHDKYYSELLVNMWPKTGYGRHFSIGILNDALNSVENNLLRAEKRLK